MGSPDDSQGTKHERKKMKSEEQLQNEELIKSMIKRGVKGELFSVDEMAQVISNFQSRMKAPRPLHYTLEIGTSFSIPVSMFHISGKDSCKRRTSLEGLLCQGS